jgi:hypothetical protein
MFRPWIFLLRAFGRHALVAVGIMVVLVAPLSINCMPCVNTDNASSVVAGTTGQDLAIVVSDNGLGDPADPEQCDHCHCTAPAAIVPDHTVRFPAPLVSRNTVRRAPTQAPDDPVFVPDPPPNRV